MRFLHTADLHLGKRVNDFSMIDEQKYILKQIISIAKDEKIDAMLISGDVYDKNVPIVEAVELLDEFLQSLVDLNCTVFMIGGNHDSAQRLQFASSFLEKSKIYVKAVYEHKQKPIKMTDENGEIFLYLLPFIKPSSVKKECDTSQIESYDEAISFAIKSMEVDYSKRNIILAHQFVIGAKTCESEELVVGGSEQVSAKHFDEFDYVALGHLHSPQTVGQKHIRYSGTPLKYSFSEIKHKKSVTIVDIKEKDNIEIYTRELIAQKDLREEKWKFDEIFIKALEQQSQDYMHVILTDEEDVVNALGKLREVYPNIMKLSYDNTRTKKELEIIDLPNVEQRNPEEIFEEFYELRNNKEITLEGKNIINKMVKEVWGEM